MNGKKTSLNRRSFLRGGFGLGLAAGLAPAGPAMARSVGEAPPFRRVPALADIWRTEPAVEIGQRKQLMVDNFFVSQWWNVSREVCRLTKENGGQPVIVPDRPWEK